jgi:aspartate aminotransferase
VVDPGTANGVEIDSDSTFCRYLLERYDVAVVPGSCFGLAPFFRLSYATSEQNLREALRRIAKACEELS